MSCSAARPRGEDIQNPLPRSLMRSGPPLKGEVQRGKRHRPHLQQRAIDLRLLEDAERVRAEAMARAAAERARAGEPQAEMLGLRPPRIDQVGRSGLGSVSGSTASLATKRTSRGSGAGGGTRRTTGRSSKFMIASSFAALGRRNGKDRMGEWWVGISRAPLPSPLHGGIEEGIERAHALGQPLRRPCRRWARRRVTPARPAHCCRVAKHLLRFRVGHAEHLSEA